MLVLSSKFKLCWFCLQNSTTSPQLSSWFKLPSFLPWIFGVASPCFLSCSPAVYSHRVAKASTSLLFSEPSRALLSFRINARVLTVTQKTLRDLDLFLLTLSPFSFPSLCSSHFSSCMPMAALGFHCIIINLQWVRDKALVIYNLAEKCESFFFFFRCDKVRHSLFYSASWKEREMGISRK